MYKLRLINSLKPIPTFKHNSHGRAFRKFTQLKEKYPTGALDILNRYNTTTNQMYLLSNTIKKSNEIKKIKTMDSKEQGKKYDSNKPMAGAVIRVFPQAIMALGAVIREGTKKYPNPNNWKLNENIEERYFDSLIRHMCKHFSGTIKDEDTGLPHLIHACWNSVAILEKFLIDNPDIANAIMYPKEIRG